MNSLESTPAVSTLLLLPPIPYPPTFATLKAAYNAPLISCLRTIAQPPRASGRRILDIALPCPHLYGSKASVRVIHYASTQTAVANLYKLICIISAKEGFDIESSGGIDARIILVAYPKDGKLDAISEQEAQDGLEGPVIEIAALAKCHKRWDKLFSVDSEQGEQVLQHFLSYGKPAYGAHKLRGGVVLVFPAQQTPGQDGKEAKRCQHVAVGGTFDHLHTGHKLLLTMVLFAVDSSPTEGEERTVTIGITAEDLLKNKKYAEFLEDWHDRYASVHRFLHGILSFDPAVEHPEQVSEIKNPGPNGHAVLARYPSGLLIKYVEIWDPFGPTITDEKIDTLVISAETRSGGNAVNQKRKEQGWSELEVLEVDVLDAEEAEDGEDKSAQPEGVQESFQNKLSSTEIRKMQAERSKGRSKV